MPPTAAPAHERDAVWSEVRERLRATLNGQTYKFAFSGARPVMLDDDRIVLAVDTELLRQWIRQRYLPLLRDALFEIRGSDLEVEITVEEREDAPADAQRDEPATEGSATPDMRSLQPRRSSGLQPRFTFEAFVTGPSNRFAQAAALAVAEAPARAYNPFFIYGGVGLGKTHLLHAIGHFVEANHPELELTYVSVETFTNEFINALRDGGIRSFKDRYRNTDILLIDDIQSLEGREQTQEEFFHTFNALHDSGKQIVISSDRPPKAIATLEDRLRSRFEMGLITDVQPPDIETRIAILQKRVRADRYEIHDPEVLSFIAGRVLDQRARPRGRPHPGRRSRLHLGAAHHRRAGARGARGPLPGRRGRAEHLGHPERGLPLLRRDHRRDERRQAHAPHRGAAPGRDVPQPRADRRIAARRSAAPSAAATTPR